MGYEIPLPEVARTILSKNRIAILTHIDPDGDTLGSCAALAESLRNSDKKADVVIEDGKIPSTYNFLDILFLQDLDASDYDLIIAIDSASVERLGKRKEAFKKSKLTVNIDHHTTNTFFADYNYVNTEASSCGEIIFNLLKQMNYSINTYTATALYVAISTDTGGFRFSNTKPGTHKTAAKLLECGLTMELSEITRLLFDRSSFEKVILTGKAISNMRLYLDGWIAVTVINQDEMKEIKARDEDCEGIVNIGRNIEGVEVSVFARQREDGAVKVNLRSNNKVDVSEIATAFKGGGHARAAGFTADGDINSIIEKVVSMAEGGMKP